MRCLAAIVASNLQLLFANDRLLADWRQLTAIADLSPPLTSISMYTASSGFRNQSDLMSRLSTTERTRSTPVQLKIEKRPSKPRSLHRTGP